MKTFHSIIVTKRKILLMIGVVAVAGLAAKLISPAVQSVFGIHMAQAERKLPIYCVDTPEKKIAISFDAAWGA